MSEKYYGVFRGRKTIQRSGTIGGARSVFVKLQGNKNELVYPTFGGFIQNPPTIIIDYFLFSTAAASIGRQAL